MVLEASRIPSHGASPIILIQLRYATLSVSTFVKPVNPAIPASCDALSFEITRRERLLQDVVGEVLAQSVWITQTFQLRGQDLVESRSSIRLFVAEGV